MFREPMTLAYKPVGKRTQPRVRVVEGTVQLTVVQRRDLENRPSEIVLLVSDDGLVTIGRRNPVGSRSWSIRLDELLALVATSQEVAAR
jgi:hypothetical protein